MLISYHPVNYTYSDDKNQHVVGKIYIDFRNNNGDLPNYGYIKPALLVYGATGSDLCVPLITPDDFRNNRTFFDPDNVVDGLTIHDKVTGFRLNLKCNYKLHNPSITVKNKVLTIESKFACGFYNEAGRFFDAYKARMSVFLIMVGVFLIIMGLYNTDYLALVLGFLFGFSFCFIIFWVSTNSDNGYRTYCLISILAILTGILHANIVYKHVDVIYLILSFAFGYLTLNYLFILIDPDYPDVS